MDGSSHLTGRDEEAVSVFNDVIRRFSGDSEPKMRAEVAKALFHKAVCCSRIENLGGRAAPEDPAIVLRTLFEKYEHDEADGVKRTIQRAKQMLAS